MIVKLLTEHHLEFLSLTGGCRGPSESTLIKMSNCWKSHAAAQMCLVPLTVVAYNSEWLIVYFSFIYSRRITVISGRKGIIRYILSLIMRNSVVR